MSRCTKLIPLSISMKISNNLVNCLNYDSFDFCDFLNITIQIHGSSKNVFQNDLMARFARYKSGEASRKKSLFNVFPAST
jgi:hypothetical protein